MTMTTTTPSRTVTLTWAGLYVFSGICQPLIMTLCKQSGLADPTAQLYMFFYTLGPASLMVTLRGDKIAMPSRQALIRASAIALFDLFTQALNYTGAALAGPTVFAIVYSAVTIWTAVFSRLLLHRVLSVGQWFAILLVFGGLSLTATDSVKVGVDVARGTAMVVVGSVMHGLTYVMSEAIMTVTEEQMTVRQNSAIQGFVQVLLLGLWQLLYTYPRFDKLLREPARLAGTTASTALVILFSFSLANMVHSVTFFHTLKYYPGGATSAGILKGLQAVLVFVVAHCIYCGRIGGEEMCFSTGKFLSLVTVSGGVAVFGYFTDHTRKDGYSRIDPEGIALVV